MQNSLSVLARLEVRIPRSPGVLARLALLCALPWLTHCATAPSLHGIEPSYALPPPANDALDAAVMHELDDAPGRSGVRLVEQNALAFSS